MEKLKINLAFEVFSLQKPLIAAHIKHCITAALEQEGIPKNCEINVLVTNDQGIQGINHACRQIDQPTDVLSFPMFQLTAGDPPTDWTTYLDPETGLCPLGDIVISLERAAMQAKQFGHSLRREVGYLVVHSVLHLLGYDHMDDGPQKKQMRTREEEIIRSIPRMQRNAQ